MYAQYRVKPNADSELRALAYLGAYRFNLFSNFTLYLRDPQHGDEIEQLDRRVFYGGRVSYRVLHRLGGARFETSVGADARSDDIHEELRTTQQREVLQVTRNDAVHETMGGLFVNEEVAPTDWLRFDLGGRADLVTFSVAKLASDDPNAPPGGVGAAQQLSPKASAIFTPVQTKATQWDLYVNYGNGFHSNDVRGAFASPGVTPLTRAIGAEVGSRARLFERWDLAVAFWQLDLDSETVWSGDQGTTEVGGATRRRGVEIETRYELTRWLAADLDLTFTHSALRANVGNGNGLALAPKQTWAGGLSARHELGPGTARAGLRVYGIGDRPASDDGALIAPASRSSICTQAIATTDWISRSTSRTCSTQCSVRHSSQPSVGCRASPRSELRFPQASRAAGTGAWHLRRRAVRPAANSSDARMSTTPRRTH